MKLLVFAISAISLLAQQEPPNFRSQPTHFSKTALVVDRDAGTVEVRIESTGLSGGETCEYLLVAADSSHGYEALFWAHASASDIRKALIAIGVAAGESLDPPQLRFWGKGALVTATVREDGTKPLAIGEFVFDTKAERSMPDLSFVFTASPRADGHDARSIIPAYNESASVFDLPIRARKAEVYRRYVANPNLAWPAHELATLVLQRAPGLQVRELLLEMAVDSFILREPSGKALNTENSFSAMLATCFSLIEAGECLYLSVHFAGALSLAQVAEFAAMLARIDVDSAVRIEPPATNQLYYQAFLPDAKWRDPKARDKQPWELHLIAGSTTLVQHDLHWAKGASEPEIRRREIPIADSATIPAHPTVLIIFAPPTMSYAQLMALLGPLKKRHPTMYVFL
jgi:hypothetical protein